MYNSRTMLKKIMQYGVIAIIILIPLLYTPWVLFPFMVGKAIVFQILVEILLVVWVVLALRDPRERPRPSVVTMLYLLYAAWLILASVLGINFERSFWSDPSRMTGIWTILHAVAFAMIVEHLARDHATRLLILKIIVGSGVVTAIVASLLQIYPPTQVFFDTWLVNKLFGTLGNPLLFAGYLVPIIFLSLWFAFHEINQLRRWVWRAVACLQIFSLLYAGSRGGFVGMLAGGIVIWGAIILGKGANRLKKNAIIALLAVVAVYAGTVYFVRVHPRMLPAPLERLTRFSTADITTSTRLLNWRIALRAARERPFFGWGHENYRDAFDRHFDPKLLKYSVYETVSDKPHNALLEILVASGIVGLLLYLFLIAAWAQRTYRSQGTYMPFALGAMAAYLGSNFFVFDSPSSLMLFGALLGLGGGLATTATTPEQRPWRLGALAAGTFALLALSPYGNFASLRPLYHASHAGEFSERNVVKWYEEAKLALGGQHPYHDEIRKILVQDFISWATSGKFPATYAPEALPLLRGAIDASARAHPEYTTWHFLAAQLAIAQFEENGDVGLIMAAKQELARARAIAPKHQALLLLAGRIALAERKPEEAVLELRRAVELAPDASEAHWFLSIALIVNGDELEALNEFETSQALGRSPNDTDEILLIADLYAKHKQYEKLISLFLQAVRMDPEHAGAWYARLAATYGLLGDEERAREYVREAVLRDPTLGAEAQKFLDELKAKKQ